MRSDSSKMFLLCIRPSPLPVYTHWWISGMSILGIPKYLCWVLFLGSGNFWLLFLKFQWSGNPESVFPHGYNKLEPSDRLSLSTGRAHSTALTTPCHSPSLLPRSHCSSGSIGIWLESPGISHGYTLLGRSPTKPMVFKLHCATDPWSDLLARKRANGTN